MLHHLQKSKRAALHLASSDVCVPQAKLPALAFISQAAKQVVERGSETADQVVIQLLKTYRCAAALAL